MHYMMVFNILIPELGSLPKNSKDAVISILSQERPLSIRAIYHRVKKNYKYQYTYQAIFKAIKELVNAKVLIREEKGYEINIDWVKKLQSFTDIIETNYYAKERNQNISGIKDSNHGDDVLILNFDSLFDAEKYLYYFMKSELFKSEGDTICYKTNQEWRPAFYLRAEYNYYKRLIQRKHKFYFMCSGNSEKEKIAAKFYKSIGVNFKFVKERFPNDVLIFGDYLINIFIPETFAIKIRNFLKKGSIVDVSKILEKKISVKVIISKDKVLSRALKKQCVRNFK